MCRKCGLTSRTDQCIIPGDFPWVAGQWASSLFLQQGDRLYPISTSCGTRRPQAGHFKHFPKQWAPKLILLSVWTPRYLPPQHSPSQADLWKGRATSDSSLGVLLHSTCSHTPPTLPLCRIQRERRGCVPAPFMSVTCTGDASSTASFARAESQPLLRNNNSKCWMKILHCDAMISHGPVGVQRRGI